MTESTIGEEPQRNRDIRETLVNRLQTATTFGYRVGQSDAAEPLALAALAFLGENRAKQVRRCSDRLEAFQNSDGSIGVRPDQSPFWPTALAAFLWAAAREKHAPRENAVQWLLTARGEPVESTRDIVGHDTSLIAWPWVLGTHSWLEPTAMAVAALKANGLGDHGRTRQAIRLLNDRLLPNGGCNYGNTEVLGQTLRPHLQPSGMCLWALQGEKKTPKSLATIEVVEQMTRELSDRGAAPVSHSWGVIGLSAENVETAVTFSSRALGSTDVMSLSLMILALQRGQSPLITAIQKPATIRPRKEPSHA
jgi:hypothetical protein